jgi:hypothetical protein
LYYLARNKASTFVLKPGIMKKYLPLLVIVFTCMMKHARSQFDSLLSIKSSAGHIYYSTGHEKRAADITKRFEKAMIFYQQLLESKPTITLLILNSSDWKKYTTMGAVYGMPHYDVKNKTLFVAAADNPFWKSFLPPLDQLPPALREQVQTVYKNSRTWSCIPLPG